MTGWEFQECLAHIACLGRDGFKRVWGDELGGYLWLKYSEREDGYNRDLAKFILYLDNGNVSILMKYLHEHLRLIRVYA